MWFWAAATLLAIYSTLGFASTIAGYLREHNLLTVVVAVAALTIATLLAISFFRRRPSWQDIGVALGVVFAYSLVWVRMGNIEERTHLIEYGVVAALIHMALLERQRNGATVYRPAALAFVATAVFGALDESIQAFLPTRVFDFRDIFFNTLAGFMMIAARLAIAPQTGPGWRVWFLWLMGAAIGWGNGVYWGWFTPEEPKLWAAVPSNLMAGYSGIAVGALVFGALQWLVLRKFIKQPYKWLLASVGAVVITGSIIFVGDAFFAREKVWTVAVSFFGTVLGVLQWLTVRKELPYSPLWILASTLGWIVGIPAGDAVGPPGLGAVYGAITGCAIVWLLQQMMARRGASNDS